MRRTAIASLSVAVVSRATLSAQHNHACCAHDRVRVPTQVSRAVLTFGRSRDALLLALVGLSPLGEAVLSTGEI